MSGTYRRLEPGQYRLAVEDGQGPAGIRRPDGHDVVLGVHGGTRDFSLDRPERVYYWWRGAERKPGVRLEPETPPGPRGRDRRLVGTEG